MTGVRALGGFAPAVLAALCLWPSAAFSAGRPVSFPSTDGTALGAQLYENASKPAPGVVLVPMLSRTRADWDGVASELEAAGIVVLALDLRGHGASGGSPSDLALMVRDVRAAVQWLGARPGVRPDALGTAGASLGANLALLAAAEQPGLRAVAAVSPSLDYRGVRVSPDLMRKLAACPVWLAASHEDPFASRTMRELSIEGPGTREQQLSAVGGHGTTLIQADRDLARALVDWLRLRLLS